MGLTDLRIVFDDPRSTYCPGQTVTGRVVVALGSSKKIRGIAVAVKGVANTRWSRNERERNDDGGFYANETETAMTGREEYFAQRYYLVGSAAGGEMELPSGEHEYPFACSLPPNLPSSFESRYGHVRYTVKVTLDRPWKFDQEAKAAFTVSSSLDLNGEPRAAEPVTFEASKTYGWPCCPSLPLRVTASLPARGYVPGQAIPVKLAVDNLSGIIVETVRLMLLRIVVYRATTPRPDTETDDTVVAEVSKGPFEAGSSVEYEQTLEIPPIPPSRLDGCSIIDLEYNLKIEARVSGWYRRNPRSKTEILIGTVPILTSDGFGRDIGGYIPVRPSAPELPDDFQPPSYEESLWTARSLREPGESEQILGLGGHFAPRYPVYNFAPPPLPSSL